MTNVFFKAQFNCCPVVWIFHTRSFYNKINCLHERCLIIIYNDFEELLVKDNPVSIHNHNIHTLAIEMYKVANRMSPEIMNDTFKLRDNTYYHLQYQIHILGTKCGSRYLPKLKTSFLLIVLKKKLERGNLWIDPGEFAKFSYPT